MNNRPLTKIKPLLKDGVFKLSKYEYRFLRLLQELNNPLTEKKIIDFYKSNVQQNEGRYFFEKGEWTIKPYSKSEERRLAIVWFDGNLGRMIRKQLLSDKGNIKLNELVLNK